MGHFLQGNKSEQSSSSRPSVRSLLRPGSRHSSRHALQNTLTAEVVAALPPPGLSGPSTPVFSPTSKSNNDASASDRGRYLAFLSSGTTANSRRHGKRSSNGILASPPSSGGSSSSTSSGERQLCAVDLRQLENGSTDNCMFPLLRVPPRHSNRWSGAVSPTSASAKSDSLEERLRRERQRLSGSGGATQFSWTFKGDSIRILVPLRGNIYIQDGIQRDLDNNNNAPLRLVYDKHTLQNVIFGKEQIKTSGPVVGRDASAIDPQLSPDGTMVAFVVAGDIYVLGLDCEETTTTATTPTRITFGALNDESGNSCITHGLADFVAQEEMDRYRGYWWEPSSKGILFARVDESNVPPYRITHQGRDGSSDEPPYEDHRYPFAGKENPQVCLGYVEIDNMSICNIQKGVVVEPMEQDNDNDDDDEEDTTRMLMEEEEVAVDDMSDSTLADEVAQENWSRTKWLDPPREAKEYLARVLWLPDGSACAQWQNRTQSTLVVVRMDLEGGKTKTLLTERSDVWINLNHMMRILPRPIHPDECIPAMEKQQRTPNPLPPGSFSFFFASERSGYSHLYLYTYAPGCNGERAMLIRTISGGEWIVESIAGVDLDNDAVYITGTFGSPLERHLFALPITNRHNPSVGEETDGSKHSEGHNNHNHGSQGNGVRRGLKHVMSALSGKPSSLRKSSGSLSSSDSALVDTTGVVDPIRLTHEPGMHNIVMDDACRLYVDTSSDLDRPTSVKLYTLPDSGPFHLATTTTSTGSTSRGKKASRKQVDAHDSRNGNNRLLCVLYDAAQEEKSMPILSSILPDPMDTDWATNLPPPELFSFPTTDGTETLHAALYKPDPVVHGPGPYPLICAVYGGPHVQRVNKSWSQSADMRAQFLRSLGFAVVKCDNRGSSRRGLAFESSIRGRLGRLEVWDQVTTVRNLTMRGIADPNRVGIYGWSYGGYLAAMCLCRAPDVFHVAVAGAPVTSWDGYDTHYTERYMGLPSENTAGYREAAIFDHVSNMKGKLMIVHGLIDENVHFRHTARLIDRLIAAGKEYDLLIFPDERHSPRRLRDRIYMEQRISDYFLRNLMNNDSSSSNRRSSNNNNHGSSSGALRTMPGHL